MADKWDKSLEELIEALDEQYNPKDPQSPNGAKAVIVVATAAAALVAHKNWDYVPAGRKFADQDLQAPADDIARIPPNSIKGIAGLTLTALRADTIARLDPSHIGAVTAEQIAALAAKAVVLTIPQINAITPEQIAAVTDEQIDAVKKVQCSKTKLLAANAVYLAAISRTLARENDWEGAYVAAAFAETQRTEAQHNAPGAPDAVRKAVLGKL